MSTDYTAQAVEIFTSTEIENTDHGVALESAMAAAYDHCTLDLKMELPAYDYERLLVPAFAEHAYLGYVFICEAEGLTTQYA